MQAGIFASSEDGLPAMLLSLLNTSPEDVASAFALARLLKGQGFVAATA